MIIADVTVGMLVVQTLYTWQLFGGEGLVEQKYLLFATKQWNVQAESSTLLLQQPRTNDYQAWTDVSREWLTLYWMYEAIPTVINDPATNYHGRIISDKYSGAVPLQQP